METRHRFRFFVEYLFARGLFAVFGHLPSFFGRPLGRFLGRTIGRFTPRRRAVALDNLTHAFPGETPGNLRGFLGEVWAGLGEWFWEFSQLPRLTPVQHQEAVHLEGVDGLHASQSLGRGVLIFTAHCGNWEYVPSVLALSGLPLAMIARRTKNPHVNAFITAIRERFGARVFLHKNAVRESLRWLKSGNVLGLLFDQRITDGGLISPFFGRPAHTTGLPALLALRVRCPVHPIATWREKGKIFIKIGPAMEIPDAPPTSENIAALTDRMNVLVETMVRDHPTQWLWIHNRWKI